MTDKRTDVVERRPAPISIPKLPCDGSYSRLFDLLKTPEEIVNRDADYCQAHSRFLEAKTAATEACLGLVSARMHLARVMVELATLPETCRREQEHKLRMLSLKNEVEATETAIILAEARARFAQTNGPKPQSPAPSNDALSIDDVESILSQFPEIDTDSIGKVSMLLRALLREKSA